MTEGEKPDLSKIEPIGRAPDSDAEPGSAADVSRGPTAAATIGSSPAVVVEDEAARSGRPAEPKTSPETEAQLEDLRRG
jgi:hypothetical protein